MSVTHVVERCPACGVEHDEAVGGQCEACGTPLRAWCRRHGGDAGWLDGPVCPRCAQEAARLVQSPALRAASPAPAAAVSGAPNVAAHPPAAPGAGEPVPPLGLLGHLRLLGVVTLVLVTGCGTVGAVLGTGLALLGGDWSFVPFAVKMGIGVGLFASVVGTANYLFDRVTGRNE